jgi:hypothetical protein
MISDVLFDAIQEIRRYQREFPECYKGLELEIARVITVMDELRAKLEASRRPHSTGKVELTNGV